MKKDRHPGLVGITGFETTGVKPINGAEKPLVRSSLGLGNLSDP
jgi:hypothetical protein